jgi:hypothetical protein
VKRPHFGLKTVARAASVRAEIRVASLLLGLQGRKVERGPGTAIRMAEDGGMNGISLDMDAGRGTSPMEPFSNLVARKRFIGHHKVRLCGTRGLGFRQEAVGEDPTANRPARGPSTGSVRTRS